MTVTSPAPIYLDHNATTPVLTEVVDAILPFLRDFFGNSSSFALNPVCISPRKHFRVIV